MGARLHPIYKLINGGLRPDGHWTTFSPSFVDDLKDFVSKDTNVLAWQEKSTTPLPFSW